MLATPLQLIDTSKNLHRITHHLDISDQVMCLYTVDLVIFARF